MMFALLVFALVSLLLFVLGLLLYFNIGRIMAWAFEREARKRNKKLLGK